MYVNLHEDLVYLEQEDVADVVLGVTLERNNETGFLEMFQDGLIESIVEALGLYYGMVMKNNTHLEVKQLVKDKYGHPGHGKLSYISGVLIILYLAGHTRPNIACYINYCV